METEIGSERQRHRISSLTHWPPSQRDKRSAKAVSSWNASMQRSQRCIEPAWGKMPQCKTLSLKLKKTAASEKGRQGFNGSTGKLPLKKAERAKGKPHANWHAN